MIDSLEVIVNNTGLSDQDKVIPLARLGTAYSTATSDLEKALGLIKRSASLAKLQSDAKYAAYSYSQLASLYSNMDSMAQAYAVIDTCMYYLEKTEDVNIKSDALTTLARSKLIYGDHSGVLEMLLQAYELQKEDQTGDKLNPIYFMLYVYYSSSDLEKTKEYAERTLKEALKSQDLNAVCRAWSAVGAAHYLTSDKDSRDSAMYALRQSIHIYENNRSTVEYINSLVSMANMSSIFLEKQDAEGKLLYVDSVLYYAQKGYKLAEEMQDVQFTAGLVPLIANVQFDEGRVKLAEQTILEGLAFIEAKTGFYGQKEHLHNVAYSLYKQTRDYEKALKHKEKEMEYLKQINEQKYITEGKITETKYKVREKEHELMLSKQEAKRQKQLFIGSVLGAVLLLIFLFIFYQFRLRSAKQKAEIHEKEKEEIRLHALIKEKELQQSESEKKALALEQELEKERAALEISRLQKELMIGISQLDQKSDTIEKIKKAIEENDQLNNREIKELLSTDKMADKSFEDFSDLLQKVHPGFFLSLQERAEQKLSSLDLKYCTYIFMDLSSKEISNIMHVDPNTVRTTKYRLKQKLQLTKEEDLSAFIKLLANR